MSALLRCREFLEIYAPIGTVPWVKQLFVFTDFKEICDAITKSFKLIEKLRIAETSLIR